ncbi:threonine/serine exporter family protein [Atopobacter phocae]|uniref:threonine/serine exporter family protein n=1 Tax=Atopobacter phocae TaxID=136492 RepID=UPI00046F9E82|nr:threonine/serine exporter family protein [Atopobacter phocae]
MSILLQIIGAAIGSFSACLIFEAPRFSWKINPFFGGAGWALYLWVMYYFQFNVPSATYFASLMIAILSHLCSRHFKAPVTVFFIPAFFPFVPGYGMYKSVYSFMFESVESGLNELGQTFAVAGMIALAIFTADSGFRIYSNIKRKIKVGSLN